MINTNKLKGAIMAAGHTQETLAEKLGITAAALNGKINNRSQFKANEIFILADLLDITDLRAVFYAQ